MASGRPGDGQVVYPAVHQPGGQCGRNGTRSAEPSFVQHEQPEPRAVAHRRFRQQQPGGVHAEDGSGYQFLVEMLTELNQRNPQVASRLIEPLIRLKRYDEKRQALMRAALEQLKGLKDLSGDLYEKISKALA